MSDNDLIIIIIKIIIIIIIIKIIMIITMNFKEGKRKEELREKIEPIWKKRRQLVILGHGRWLDKQTEQSDDNIKYRVKIEIIMIKIK